VSSPGWEGTQAAARVASFPMFGFPAGTFGAFFFCDPFFFVFFLGLVDSTDQFFFLCRQATLFFWVVRQTFFVFTFWVVKITNFL